MIQNNLFRVLFVMSFILYGTKSYSQLEISTAGVPFNINFDETRADVNSGIFAANGLDPNPAIGQLDSDAWAFTGFSDGAVNFGEFSTSDRTNTGTALADYNRGEDPDAVSTGGLYAFDISNANPKNNALGFQPGGTDFTPGTITLNILNSTGLSATSMELSYEIFVYNDQGRSSTLNLSYSLDNTNYTTVPSLDFATPTTADGSPTWRRTEKSILITGLTIANSSNFYLRWTSNDNASDPGSGSRDQIAIDDIEVKIFSATWAGTTSNDWDTASNWENGTVPTSGDDVVIPSGLTNYPTKTGNLEINSISLESQSSFITTGTVSGSGGSLNAVINYKRGLGTTNWYLVSSPVSGETAGDIITEHPLAEGTSGNLGLANYDNTQVNIADRWNYFTTSSVDDLNSGEGFSVKFSDEQDLRFVGTMVTDDVSRNITVGAGDAFNLIGNPFTSYINSGNFLSTNNSSLNRQQLWLWNQALNDYEVKVTEDAFKIAPAQGFFVEASGNGSVLFEESSQSHEITPTFQKGNFNKTEVILNLKSSEIIKYTKIYYISGATKGFDNGFDGNLFGGVSYSFALYSDLLESDGKKYQIQSIPDENHEQMVVPIGVIVEAGKEITFTAETLNLPSGIKVFLEDRETDTFTRLDEANSSYKITVNNALNGTGRFYLHTRSAALSTDEVALTGVSIFTTNKNTLSITGVNSADAALKMYNILGKKVLETSFVSKGVADVTLPNLTTGVYIVQLNTQKGKINKKIVLE